MCEQVFLCGLSKNQLAEHDSGRELQLHGPKANVRLRLDDVRQRLFKVEPELLADLAEIAVYVFAADCAIRRGGPTLANMGEGWRRTFRMVIAVRQPGVWREPARLSALCKTLRFLSEDTWHFDFVDLANPPSIQAYLGLRESSAESSGDTSIVLFSGGLDSLAGAVHELATNRRVVLLSRRVGGLTDRRQRELAGELKKRHSDRIVHVPVSAGLTKETAADEYTQRTRSFMFAAIAMVAAAIEQSDRVRFYENGIMSANLPISAQVVGARASRSTHPRSLMLLNRLMPLLLENDVRIDNPFVWKTKVEVVEELLAKPEGKLVRNTLSCSHTRGLDIARPHCGECAQCLQRRISTLGAGATGNDDPEEGYKVDLLEGPRQDGKDRAMAIDVVRSAIEYRHLTDDGFATRFATEFGWLTTSFKDQPPDQVAQKFIDMFKRHGNAVRDIFVQGTRHQATALVDKTLPENSLLRIWHETHDISLDPEFEKLARSPDVGEAIGVVDETELPSRNLDTPEYTLAIDETNRWILVQDIGPIQGPALFRLMVFLIQSHKEDDERGLSAANHRAHSPDQLADALGIDDANVVRQNVSRVRKALHAGFSKLHGFVPAQNAVIETVSGNRGYRINPRVRLVAADQIEH